MPRLTFDATLESRLRWALGFLCFAATVAAREPGSFHLDSALDRQAFRSWFAFLAESRFYAAEPTPEINDCAALVRWSFREALKPHDTVWTRELRLPLVPPLAPIRQFAYPRTPVGAGIFWTGNHWAQFADATTLRRWNTTFVSRDVRAARPGDLLFFRQFARSMPAHVMIYLGSSQFESSPQLWLVYHTGPGEHGKPGEIRKVSVDDLLRHPAPEWRPESGNSNFLGVWRFNLVRESE